MVLSSIAVHLQVERLDVGALVSIRGICRVKIANFVQASGSGRSMLCIFTDIILVVFNRIQVDVFWLH